MVQTTGFLPNMRTLYINAHDLQFDAVLYSGLCVGVNELSDQVCWICATGFIHRKGLEILTWTLSVDFSWVDFSSLVLSRMRLLGTCHSIGQLAREKGRLHIYRLAGDWQLNLVRIHLHCRWSNLGLGSLARCRLRWCFNPQPRRYW